MFTRMRGDSYALVLIAREDAVGLPALAGHVVVFHGQSKREHRGYPVGKDQRLKLCDSQSGDSSSAWFPGWLLRLAEDLE